MHLQRSARKCTVWTPAKWKTCKALQYVYGSDSLHEELNCAVLFCIIGMHSSMHNQTFFFFFIGLL